MSQSQGVLNNSSRYMRSLIELVQVGAYVGLFLAIAFIWSSLSTQADAIVTAHTGHSVVSHLSAGATVLR